MQPKFIIFTDLDGTFLDHDTYGYDESLPGLALAKQHEVPVVFCSSKTRAEQMVYRAALDIHDPFIVENGGAVLIETGTFDRAVGDAHSDGRHRVLSFGRTYGEIRAALVEIRRQGFGELRGYGDVSVEELMPLLGLDAAAVQRARRREYEETLITALTDGQEKELRSALAARGLGLTRGGRFFAVSAGNDKGCAINALAEIYRSHFSGVVTVGIGDSWNDAPMLRVVDRPFLVQRPGGRWEELEVPGLTRVRGVGPSGWTLAIRGLLSGFTPSDGRLSA